MGLEGLMKKILIVEDDKQVRRLLTVLVRGAEIHIDEAVDGVEALEKLDQACYDLVILDRMMPRLDGLEVLKAMRERTLSKATPVIIVSAKVEDKDLLEGYGAGANYYIPKPFEPRDLIHSIELILDIKYAN
jgi:two-component system, OmpR family, response regulator ResD